MTQTQFVVLFNQKLTQMPLFGRFLRVVGWLPVEFKTDAQSEVNATRESATAVKSGARMALERHQSLVVFPSGRRCPEGDLGEFRPSMFALAQAVGVPILPITIAGAGAILPIGDDWLHAGEVTLTLHPLEHPTPGEEPAAFAERIRAVLASGKNYTAQR